MEERLNKWLSRMGVCSRREEDRLISEGIKGLEEDECSIDSLCWIE